MIWQPVGAPEEKAWYATFKFSQQKKSIFSLFFSLFLTFYMYTYVCI